MPSPIGWPEVPCVECAKVVEGLDFGERCRDCHRRRKKKASALARRAALIATAAAGGWVLLNLPTSPLGGLYAAMSIPIVYLLVHVVVDRFAMELMP